MENSFKPVLDVDFGLIVRDWSKSTNGTSPRFSCTGSVRWDGSGRTKASVESVAKQIAAAGGQAHAAVVDALDGAAIDKYVDGVVKEAGHIDAVFNAVGPRFRDLATGKHAIHLTVEEFMGPVTTILKSQFNMRARWARAW